MRHGWRSGRAAVLAEAEAKDIVDRRGTEIERIANALIVNWSLSADDIRRIVANVSPAASSHLRERAYTPDEAPGVTTRFLLELT